MSYCYEYPRPALTVDCVVFGLDEEELKVLLIQRDLGSFAGCWALPGGFVEMEEDLDEAARRELQEETGVACASLEQLQAIGTVDRDPRGRVVTVAFWTLVNLADHRPEAASDARTAGWFPVRDLPGLAFDHDRIISLALARLRARVHSQPIGLGILPRKFTLTQLRRVYEKILERPLDKRSFRRRILSTGVLVDLHELERDARHRAARLYRFDRRRYMQLERDGLHVHTHAFRRANT